MRIMVIPSVSGSSPSKGAFHGRTLATIAAGGQAKYLEGFGPKVEGFDQVPFGDHDALKSAIGPETAGILIEPVQGEGGIRPVPPQCLRGLRELCDEHGILLIFDEVQCGIGRTGKLFAHEWAGIAPDIMAIAKGIGGGFPLGACLATEKAAAGMTAGTHGSTFGGNPLATAVGNAVLDVVLAEGFLDNVRQRALSLKQKLAQLKDAHPAVIEDIRGSGLMMGIKCKVPNTALQAAALDQHLLTIGAGDNVVRLLPPLVVSEADVADAVAQARPRLPRTRSQGRLRGFPIMTAAPRHFLDICDFDAATLNGIIARARAMKNARRDWPKGRREPGEPLKGRMLALIFEPALDPHAGVLRSRHAPAGRRDAGAVVERHAAGPRRNHRRHGPGAVALCAMPS